MPWHESLPVFRAVLQGEVQVLLLLETSDSALAASMINWSHRWWWWSLMITIDDWWWWLSPFPRSCVHYAAEPGVEAEGRIAIDIYLKKAAASRALSRPASAPVSGMGTVFVSVLLFQMDNFQMGGTHWSTNQLRLSQVQRLRCGTVGALL